MTTIVFCTSYIRSEAEWGRRYARWLDHYRRLPIEGGKRFLIDDASPFIPPTDVIPCVSDRDDVTRVQGDECIVRFDQRLGRSDVLSYPGWWRSFLHSVSIARALKAKKIVHLESDAFILSSRLLDYVNGLSSGWTTLWTPSYAMPETAIQIICEDQFEEMAWFQQRARRGLDGLLAEHILPFTRVEKRFKGDRYGEFKIHLLRRGLLRSKKFNRMKFFQKDCFWAQIPSDADFATQVTPRQKIWFA